MEWSEVRRETEAAGYAPRMSAATRDDIDDRWPEFGEIELS
ncbi:MAG TPA: hypothetical protein VFY84_14255 [Jiangellales bacterium]|nr:hypothetical protein [Jiangellales bacterium]